MAGTGQQQAGQGHGVLWARALLGEREVAGLAEPCGACVNKCVPTCMSAHIHVAAGMHTLGCLHRCLTDACPTVDIGTRVSVCVCARARVCTHPVPCMCVVSVHECVCTHVSVYGSWSLYMHVCLHAQICACVLVVSACVLVCIFSVHVHV